jgi:hypothetical protein
MAGHPPENVRGDCGKEQLALLSNEIANKAGTMVKSTQNKQDQS